MPRVSIVMPVFNGEKYLREAMDSILAQTFTDWEFIIINEFGSNDKATAILEEYAQNDPRIAVVQNKERLGIAASMNIGLDMAQGEYIARMDADDISMPERLKKQVEFMDSHPEIDICGIKPKLFGESCWDWKVESDPGILKSCILFFTPFVHPTVMIRTARLNQFKLRYDAQYRYTEDYDFFARASENLIFTNIQDASLYHYRMHSKNATTAGGNQGIMLYRGVTKRLLEMCGLTLTEHEVDILCIHTYPRSENVEQALDDMSELDLLLKRIFFSDIARGKYGRYPLFHALHIRWMRVKEDMQYVRPVVSDRRFEAAFGRGLFYHSEFYRADGIPAVQKPKVSVVLPAYNSEKYIADTVYSLLEQTYQNFELLIVNEFGSDDQTVNILQLFQDPRIKVIQNKIRLGLADSLNEGIRQAAGEYIARADADDLYPVHRLEKQVAFLDSHPDISVCGSWQCHFGKRDYIHQPPETPEQMKAQLLFTCDVCHSTVMFRKSDFVNNDFWYDASYLSEDFELWCRASQKLKFATIQEVLGEYRWDGENITASKMNRLDAEAQRIIARTLKNQFEINIAQEDMILLSGWFNPFQDNSRDDRKQLIDKELKLLDLIENQTRKVHVYDEDALHDTLERRKRWVQGTNLKEMAQQAIARHMTLGEIMKKVFKKVLMPFYRPVKHRVSDRFDQLRDQLWNMDGHICDVKEDVIQHDLALKNALQRIDCLEETIALQTGMLQQYNPAATSLELQAKISKSEQDILQTMDGRIWKAEQNILQTLDGRIWQAEQNISNQQNRQDYILQKFSDWYTEESYHKKLIPYLPTEKIRIVFFFQIASFWPSWESFYEACVQDSRFNVQMVLLDDEIEEKVQTQTAFQFLTDQGIPFIKMEEFSLNMFKPHIAVYQTPYDNWHRTYAHWSDSIKAEGVRIVYIPYGIEISDTAKARDDHFNCGVLKNAWRVYTFSDKMLEDYKKYSSNSEAVKALGHPKFDGLYHKEQYVLPQNVLPRINGRKICLWKVHFPNHIKVDGKDVLITPSLEEYVQFAKQIGSYSDLFFIFMPHPKFREMCQWIEGADEQADKLFALLQQQENVYIDMDDDYRPALANADYIIIDRSAVMVEAGAMDVPVLYMQNQEFQEPSTKAIEPLIQSYYHGFRSEDMIQFLESCKNGIDPEKGNREKAFHQCIPYFDGCCGKRIAEDIVQEMEKIQNELD